MKRTVLSFAFILLPLSAHADDQGTSTRPPSASTEAAHATAPVHAWTYSAAGTPAATVGAASFGSMLGGRSDPTSFGIGGRVFGAPIDGLTLLGEAERSTSGKFLPSAAAIVRLYQSDGFVFGALAKGKAKGFGGPEIEGEGELGLLVGFHRAALHVDANAMAGAGLGEEREMDGEARLRLGVDVHPHVRVGFDSIVRVRMLGDARLPGDRTWDFAVGPQVLGSWKSLYASLTAGPATAGWAAPGVGWLTTLALGVAL